MTKEQGDLIIGLLSSLHWWLIFLIVFKIFGSLLKDIWPGQ